MSGIDRALRRFAGLTRESPETEVREAVELVLAEIVASIDATSDRAGARRSVAALLNYLRAAENARHPGRTLLAIGLAETVIPRLYSDEAEAEEPAVSYRYQREEELVRRRTLEMFEATLRFLRAETDRHPCHGEDRLEDSLPPFCIFSPAFTGGVERCLAVLFQNFLRSKQTETYLYAPLAEAARDAAPDAATFQRLDPTIRRTVTSALAFAGRTLRGVPNASLVDMDVLRSDPKTRDRFTFEEMTVLEALERLRLHGQEAGYFVHRELDFELLSTLFEFRPKLLAGGVIEIRNAIANGDTQEYVMRQVERLNDTHDLNVFDMTVLTAFYFGDDRRRLSFKTLHDTCIGAASSKAGMEALRPMLAAELSRRPQQLARRLMEIGSDRGSNTAAFTAVLEAFMQSIAALNGLRFSDEIFSCVSLVWGAGIYRDLIEWIQDKDRAPSLIDAYAKKIADDRRRVLKVA